MDYHFVIELREWVAFVVECAILYWIVKEFYYDKSKDEKKTVRVRRNRKGNVEVTEQSKGVDVVIEGDHPNDAPQAD